MSKISNYLYNHVWGQWRGMYGQGKVPLDQESLWIPMSPGATDDDQYVIAFNNDAFEIWLGYPNHWLAHYDRKTWDRMIRWYLWQWAVHEWFGVRRWFYYRSLHKRVRGMLERNKARSAEAPDAK